MNEELSISALLAGNAVSGQSKTWIWATLSSIAFPASEVWFYLPSLKLNTFSGKSWHCERVKIKNKSKIKQNKKVGRGLGDTFLHLKLSAKMLSTPTTFLSNSCETWHFWALLLSQSYAPAPQQSSASWEWHLYLQMSMFWQTLLRHFDQGTCTQIIS